MGNCCGRSATVPPPSSTPTLPAPARTQETTSSTHQTSTPSSHTRPSKRKTRKPAPKRRTRKPAHDTPQHDYETTALSQGSTSSQPRGDDRDHPAPSSSSNPRSRPFRSRGGHSHQIHKPMSSDTTFSQGPRSHSPSRMTGTSPTPLLGHGPQLTGTSGPASGTSQIPTQRQERRPHFPSSLQSILSDDFRCVFRCIAVSDDNSCTIVHRFRILVTGKVCIMYPTDRRRT